MQGERHQPYAALRIEPLDRLHQPDIALLDQVGMRQAISEVVTRDRDYEAEVRHHQSAG